MTAQKVIQHTIANPMIETIVSTQEQANVIQVRRVASEAVVCCYYHPVFIEQAKALQGRWEPSTLSWHFTSKLMESLSELLWGLFHVDGLTPYPVCQLRVYEFSQQSFQEACMLFGRPVARAYGRDSGAYLQPDIYKFGGSVRSGGSSKNWRTIIDKATFEIHKYPTAALVREDVQTARAEGWLTIN